jgi:hypothetical protein
MMGWGRERAQPPGRVADVSFFADRSLVSLAYIEEVGLEAEEKT